MKILLIDNSEIESNLLKYYFVKIYGKYYKDLEFIQQTSDKMEINRKLKNFNLVVINSNCHNVINILEIAKNIRLKYKIPIIFLSVSECEKQQWKQMSIKNSMWLEKPYRYSELEKNLVSFKNENYSGIFG